MIKKILLAAILIIFVLLPVSAEVNDKPSGLYYFDAELNIEINKEYAGGTVPEEFDLNIGVMSDGDVLYVELNETLRIFLDLLVATDVISMTEKSLFDRFAGYDDGALFCIDLIDLAKYIGRDDKFTVKAKYNFAEPVQDYDFGDVFYYSEVRNKIDKELARRPGYRYVELYIILETDEDNGSFINILATRENGERKVLDRMKIDSDLSNAHIDSGAAFGEDILPMRYILELLGENVNWGEDSRRAYITKDGTNIYFDGTLINSRMYIAVTQIMVRTDYMIVDARAGEYIEIIIARRRT